MLEVNSQWNLGWKMSNPNQSQRLAPQQMANHVSNGTYCATCSSCPKIATMTSPITEFDQKFHEIGKW
jgi:hypothetical protein